MRNYIKISATIFDDDRIKLIEAMPAADEILVVYFKLLCFMGRDSDCLNTLISYGAEDLSSILNQQPNTVRAALCALESLGMIEIMKGGVKVKGGGDLRM